MTATAVGASSLDPPGFPLVIDCAFLTNLRVVFVWGPS